VVGDGDEVEAVADGGLKRDEERTGDGFAGLAGAGAVAVRGVHVQIATIPAGLIAEGGAESVVGEAFGASGFAFAGEEDVGGVGGGLAGAEVGYADEQMPASGRDGAGQVGGGGVGYPDGEAGLIAAAPAAEALGVADAEVERGVVLLAGVAEVDGDALDVGGDGEGDFEVGVLLGAGDGAVEGQAGAAGLRKTWSSKKDGKERYR